jgi:DNA polymerase III subunit epsilon
MKMMREIVIDTETTGFDPLGGHRIVEIGAVELVDHLPTGRTFHCYLNPERAVPADAVGHTVPDGKYVKVQCVHKSVPRIIE